MQGEGINAGSPAVFLRLAICNMHCWFCDTKYTWLFSELLAQTVESDLKRLGMKEVPSDLIVYDPEKEVQMMDIDRVESEIIKHNRSHLVLTGGEPLLQQKALVPLLLRLRSSVNKFYVEVETSGTVKPIREIHGLIDQWNVSPKLESSGNTKENRDKPECMRFFSGLPSSYFKFVVQTQGDLSEIDALVRTYNLDPKKIILMPEGTTKDSLETRGSWLSRVCADKGYRFTTRLHILLWGNKRGT